MNGIRFYLEHGNPQDKRKGKHTGTVFAAFVCNGVNNGPDGGSYDGLGALSDYPDSPVCSTSASRGYLRRACKRVPEAKAREIHPRLFAALDRMD